MLLTRSAAPDRQCITGRVTVVRTNTKTGKVDVFHSRNIVTDEGDKHYAQRGAGEAPTEFATIAFELGTAGNAPSKTSIRSDVTTKVSGSLKQDQAGYPKSNDGDADNTGSGVDVVSHSVLYDTSEANSAGITRVIITNWAGGTPAAGEVLLMYATLTSFTKTSDDTLKIFVNHTMNGT